MLLRNTEPKPRCAHGYVGAYVVMTLALAMGWQLFVLTYSAIGIIAFFVAWQDRPECYSKADTVDFAVGVVVMGLVWPSSLLLCVDAVDTDDVIKIA